MSNKELRITEIFYSLQGETTFVGLPTVFIRLTGCPLRCNYCDTAYAFSGGEKIKINTILAEVGKYNPRYITVSGGEPLAQPDCIELLKLLCDEGYTVSIETSGALPIQDIDPRVVVVMDLKTPSSGEEKKNLISNLEAIKKMDQIKFVIANKEDYEWSKAICNQHDLFSRCEILFSPSHMVLANKDLAEWILKDNLEVRFQIQLHKSIWGDEQGR